MDETQTIEPTQPLMKHETTKEPNKPIQTTSTKCKIQIKDQPITAIVDSGAATNIISSKLLQDLNLENIRKSDATFVIANGETVAALGKVALKIEIAQHELEVEAQVIDSNRKTFIIGTGLIRQLKANIDYDKNELRMSINNEKITIPIYCIRDENMLNSDEESDQELYEELEESENEEEYEEYEKNSAYYLASLEVE